MERNLNSPELDVQQTDEDCLSSTIATTDEIAPSLSASSTLDPNASNRVDVSTTETVSVTSTTSQPLFEPSTAPDLDPSESLFFCHRTVDSSVLQELEDEERINLRAKEISDRKLKERTLRAAEDEKRAFLESYFRKSEVAPSHQPSQQQPQASTGSFLDVMTLIPPKLQQGPEAQLRLARLQMMYAGLQMDSSGTNPFTQKPPS